MMLSLLKTQMMDRCSNWVLCILLGVYFLHGQTVMADSNTKVAKDTSNSTVKTVQAMKLKAIQAVEAYNQKIVADHCDQESACYAKFVDQLNSIFKLGENSFSQPALKQASQEAPTKQDHWQNHVQNMKALLASEASVSESDIFYCSKRKDLSLGRAHKQKSTEAEGTIIEQLQNKIVELQLTKAFRGTWEYVQIGHQNLSKLSDEELLGKFEAIFGKDVKKEYMNKLKQSSPPFMEKRLVRAKDEAKDSQANVVIKKDKKDKLGPSARFALERDLVKAAIEEENRQDDAVISDHKERITTCEKVNAMGLVEPLDNGSTQLVTKPKTVTDLIGMKVFASNDIFDTEQILCDSSEPECYNNRKRLCDSVSEFDQKIQSDYCLATYLNPLSKWGISASHTKVQRRHKHLLLPEVTAETSFIEGGSRIVLVQPLTQDESLKIDLGKGRLYSQIVLQSPSGDTLVLNNPAITKVAELKPVEIPRLQRSEPIAGVGSQKIYKLSSDDTTVSSAFFGAAQIKKPEESLLSTAGVLQPAELRYEIDVPKTNEAYYLVESTVVFVSYNGEAYVDHFDSRQLHENTSGLYDKTYLEGPHYVFKAVKVGGDLDSVLPFPTPRLTEKADTEGGEDQSVTAESDETKEKSEPAPPAVTAARLPGYNFNTGFIGSEIRLGIGARAGRWIKWQTDIVTMTIKVQECEAKSLHGEMNQANEGVCRDLVKGLPALTFTDAQEVRYLIENQEVFKDVLTPEEYQGYYSRIYPFFGGQKNTSMFEMLSIVHEQIALALVYKGISTYTGFMGASANRLRMTELAMEKINKTKYYFGSLQPRMDKAAVERYRQAYIKEHGRRPKRKDLPKVGAINRGLPGTTGFHKAYFLENAHAKLLPQTRKGWAAVIGIAATLVGADLFARHAQDKLMEDLNLARQQHLALEVFDFMNAYMAGAGDEELTIRQNIGREEMYEGLVAVYKTALKTHFEKNRSSMMQWGGK